MKETTKKIDSDEIVFRVSFGSIDDSDDFIVTKDGKYYFYCAKSLKNDKTKYKIIYPDYRYHLVRINQKYYKQALKAKKSILEKDEKDWPIYDFGRVAGRQIELYKKTLWLLSHDSLDGWKDTYDTLDEALDDCLRPYRNYCDLLYGDDSLREYRDDENEARRCLNKMKRLVFNSCSVEVSTEEFEQIFRQKRRQIVLVSLPQKDQNMVMYINIGGHIHRIECAGEQTKLAEEIVNNLEKSKVFKHHKGYFDMVNGEKMAPFFCYANELSKGIVRQQNHDLAYKIYTYLAERWNQPDAFYDLGVFYQYGYGSLKKDTKTAVKYYEKALTPVGSLRGRAANNLGYLYMTGDGGVPKDEKKALDYYRTASSNGDAYAKAGLAKIYEEGKLVERNRLLAWELYNEARDLIDESDNYDNDEEIVNFRGALIEDIERLEKKLK